MLPNIHMIRNGVTDKDSVVFQLSGNDYVEADVIASVFQS